MMICFRRLSLIIGFSDERHLPHSDGALPMKPKAIHFKVMFERIKGYASFIQFGMVAWLFISTGGYEPISTILLLSGACLVIGVVDIIWILPSESKALSERNPLVREQMDIIRRLDNDLKIRQQKDNVYQNE